MLKKLFTAVLPWPLRRLALNRWFGYKIHPSAKIGFSWIFPGKLTMGPNARIDHFTVAIHLDEIIIGEDSFIGRSNWITGFPGNIESRHFRHQLTRRSALLIGRHSAITKHHHIDCTNLIFIGDFVTVAGYQTQLLTHSIDIYEGRQDSKPIRIDNYCFVGTNCTILGGSILPSYCVLGAKSLLNKPFHQPYQLYAGNPAKAIKALSKDAKYFTRDVGFIY